MIMQATVHNHNETLHVHSSCKVLWVQSYARLVKVRCFNIVIFPEDYKNKIILFLLKFTVIYLEQCR